MFCLVQSLAWCDATRSLRIHCHVSDWGVRGGARPKNGGWRLDAALASPKLAPSVTCEVRATFPFDDHVPIVSRTWQCHRGSDAFVTQRGRLTSVSVPASASATHRVGRPRCAQVTPRRKDETSDDEKRLQSIDSTPSVEVSKLDCYVALSKLTHDCRCTLNQFRRPSKSHQLLALTNGRSK